MDNPSSSLKASAPARIINPPKLIERFELGTPLEEDVSLNEPGQPSTGLIRDVTTGRNAKDEVEFLERTLPRLWSV